MNKNTDKNQKKRLNLFGLISALAFLLVFPLLLIPWYRIFLLRSNTITTLVIHIIGIFTIGIVMLVFGIIALVRHQKHKGQYKGAWLGIVGLVLGFILTSASGYIILDYLIRGAA